MTAKANSYEYRSVGCGMYVFQLRPSVMAAQVPLLDVLDDIPADPQVPGHILDGGKTA
jgi:hypothetical protein